MYHITSYIMSLADHSIVFAFQHQALVQQGAGGARMNQSPGLEGTGSSVVLHKDHTAQVCCVVLRYHRDTNFLVWPEWKQTCNTWWRLGRNRLSCCKRSHLLLAQILDGIIKMYCVLKNWDESPRNLTARTGIICTPPTWWKPGILHHRISICFSLQKV